MFSVLSITPKMIPIVALRNLNKNIRSIKRVNYAAYYLNCV